MASISLKKFLFFFFIFLKFPNQINLLSVEFNIKSYKQEYCLVDESLIRIENPSKTAKIFLNKNCTTCIFWWIKTKLLA